MFYRAPSCRWPSASALSLRGVRSWWPPSSSSVNSGFCRLSSSGGGAKKRVLSRMSLPVLPDVSRLSSRVLRILGCNPSFMTLQGTNTYVVGTGEKRILIDTGEPDTSEYIKNLQETMIKYNFQLDHIIITHWHSDHIGGVPNVLDMISNKNECKVWKFNAIEKKKRVYKFPLNFIEDQQVFHVEGATLKIHHSPGHTMDHIYITLEEENILFSADAVLGEGSTVFEDLDEYLKSLKLILDLKPTIIFPGHGSIVKDPIERVNKYINHRLEREVEIYNLISKHPDESASIDYIVAVLYKDISSDYKEVVEYIIRQHLVKLMKDDKVYQSEDQWKIRKNSNL